MALPKKHTILGKMERGSYERLLPTRLGSNRSQARRVMSAAWAFPTVVLFEAKRFDNRELRPRKTTRQ